ncbi:PREDICTED: opioid growth factor receptor-like, partial [Gekko japonicus]|uniref:Opioid growth factor receptor-like n=1 Tax=Gekko japonicus TaxID=146911 RepID=A0ABM1K7E3_GEKJA
YTHNNLRITRILKCLGEMGKEHYQVHLVKFFLTETLVHQMLPRVMRSALDYFMFTVRSKQKRRELVHFAWRHFEPKHEFVWGPRKKLLDFKPRSSELLNNVAPKDEPEPPKDGAAEGVEQNKSQLPNETGVVGNAADGSNDSVKGPPDLDGDAAGTQPVSKQKTSEKTEEANSESASDVRAEGEDVKAGPPRGKMKPDGKDPASDCSSGGTDGEYLKESKKRKFETNKHSGDSAGLSRSPTDIEKIASNLEEVAIDREDPDREGLPLTEMSKPSMGEGNGGDCQDLKEVDSVSAVVKRRKVDEMVPDEKIVETATKPDAEATSSKSQLPSFKVPSPETTAEVCPTGAQISNGVPSEAQSDCRTAGGVEVPVNSETSTANSGLPFGDPEPDTSNTCIVTSMTENEGSQSCSALTTGQEEDGSGQEEAGMKGRQEGGGSGQEEEGMKGRQEGGGSGQEEVRIKGRQEEGGSGQEEVRIKGRQEEGSPGQEGGGTKGKAEEASNFDGVVKATESATSLAKPEAERNSR